MSIGHLSSEVQYYHDFGYVNALGFSYGNYYILTSTESEHMGYFDNIVPSTSDEMVKYDFLYDLGFDMSVWETRNTEYVLEVEWDE